MNSILGINTLLILVLTSCTSVNYVPFKDVEVNENCYYDNFYIVDTIEILDPVRIVSQKFGGQFVASRAILKEYDGKKTFFSRPDVFLLLNDIYRDLPLADYDRYLYRDHGGCTDIKSSDIIRDMEIYEYKENKIFFILGLINSSYYWIKHSSYDYFDLPGPRDKNSYYRVAYQLCK